MSTFPMWHLTMVMQISRISSEALKSLPASPLISFKNTNENLLKTFQSFKRCRFCSIYKIQVLLVLVQKRNYETFNLRSNRKCRACIG